MTTYNVVMGQGVSVPDLTGHKLVTGFGSPGDALQSCSAIIMARTNEDNNMIPAGIYHYPASDITKKENRSKKIIKKMIAKINPNELYIVFGTVDYYTYEIKSTPADNSLNILREYIKKKTRHLNSVVKLRQANSGRASVSLENNRVLIGPPPDVESYTNLQTLDAGEHAFVTIYR